MKRDKANGKTCLLYRSGTVLTPPLQPLDSLDGSMIPVSSSRPPVLNGAGAFSEVSFKRVWNIG